MLESRETWTGNRLQKNFSHISLKSLLAKLGDSSVLSLVTFNLSQSLLSPLSHLYHLWMSNPAGSFAAPSFTMDNRLGLPIHRWGLAILSDQDILPPAIKVIFPRAGPSQDCCHMRFLLTRNATPTSPICVACSCWWLMGQVIMGWLLFATVFYYLGPADTVDRW